MPVLAPPAVFIAVTARSDPPATIVIAPKETMVDAVVDVPVIEILFADIAPISDTAVLAFDALVTVIAPALAVRVPFALVLTPGFRVALVLVELAVRVMLPAVEVKAEVK